MDVVASVVVRHHKVVSVYETESVTVFYSFFLQRVSKARTSNTVEKIFIPLARVRLFLVVVW